MDSGETEEAHHSSLGMTTFCTPALTTTNVINPQPSHHHHDHNYEVRKYVELGAQIIVPEISAPLWRQIPNAKLITFR